MLNVNMYHDTNQVESTTPKKVVCYENTIADSDYTSY